MLVCGDAGNGILLLNQNLKHTDMRKAAHPTA
jgi:hypothetical protein